MGHLPPHKCPRPNLNPNCNLTLNQNRPSPDRLIQITLTLSLKSNAKRNPNPQILSTPPTSTPHSSILPPKTNSDLNSPILTPNLGSGWLGSRVVSVLDSGAEGPGFKSQSCLRQTVHTHCTSVHQAAKLVAALLRVAG